MKIYILFPLNNHACRFDQVQILKKKKGKFAFIGDHIKILPIKKHVIYTVYKTKILESGIIWAIIWNRTSKYGTAMDVVEPLWLMDDSAD